MSIRLPFCHSRLTDFPYESLSDLKEYTIYGYLLSLAISPLPYIMSIFRLSRKLEIPHLGCAVCITGESGRIYLEKLGPSLETCIAIPHVQIPFIMAGKGNVA